MLVGANQRTGIHSQSLCFRHSKKFAQHPNLNNSGLVVWYIDTPFTVKMVQLELHYANCLVTTMRMLEQRTAAA